MFYLVTDKNNNSQNFEWSENCHHISKNENYDFCIYKSLEIARYMHPYFPGSKEANIWLCNPIQETQIGYQLKCKELTTLKKIEVEFPTIEQRINFGILCALNVVQNPIFINWAKNYLKNIDKTKETAIKIKNDLIKQLNGDNEILEHCSSATTILTGIQNEEYFFIPAATAHRAYNDSFDYAEFVLDIEKMAVISNVMNSEQISEFLTINS